MKLLSWIRQSHYNNYIATDFVFKPLEMGVSLEYGIGDDLVGFNNALLFSESSTNVLASQIGLGGKTFAAGFRNFSDVMFLVAQASSANMYAQAWSNAHLNKTTSPSNVIINIMDIVYTSPWNPILRINGEPSSPRTIGGKNVAASSQFSNYGIAFFAHRNGNGNIIAVSPNSDWVIPQYYLRSCQFKSLSTGEVLADFRAAMAPSGDVGLIDLVSDKFYASTNGQPLFGM